MRRRLARQRDHYVTPRGASPTEPVSFPAATPTRYARRSRHSEREARVSFFRPALVAEFYDSTTSTERKLSLLFQGLARLEQALFDRRRRL
jgi:hypothetical protein